MSIVVFQHNPQEDAAALGRALNADGHRLRTIRLDQNQPVPVDLDDVDGLVIMGGSQNVDQTDQFPWLESEMDYIRKVHEADLPVVGVCLGHQLIATALGGKVAPMHETEVGWQPVQLAFPGTIDPLMAGIKWNIHQFHLHGQEVTDLPAGATPLTGSKLCRTQAFKVGMRTYAFQYHFEWNLDEIKRMLDDDLVTQAGTTAAAILDEAKTYYPLYRQMGDRLCKNIVMLLMAAAVKY